MTGRTLHFLRHGEPEGAGRLHGHTNTPSTVAGNAACVRRVMGLDLQQIIASDLSRARDAAAAIAEDMAVPFSTDARWRELHFGAWDGCDQASLSQEDLAAFWDDPNANPPPEGETWSALCARVSEALPVVADRTLIVAHAGSIRAALCVTLGLSYNQAWAIYLPYAALVSIKIWPGPDPSGQMIGLVA